MRNVPFKTQQQQYGVHSRQTPIHAHTHKSLSFSFQCNQCELATTLTSTRQMTNPSSSNCAVVHSSVQMCIPQKKTAKTLTISTGCVLTRRQNGGQTHTHAHVHTSENRVCVCVWGGWLCLRPWWSIVSLSVATNDSHFAYVHYSRAHFPRNCRAGAAFRRPSGVSAPMHGPSVWLAGVDAASDWCSRCVAVLTIIGHSVCVRTASVNQEHKHT